MGEYNWRAAIPKTPYNKNREAYLSVASRIYYFSPKQKNYSLMSKSANQGRSYNLRESNYITNYGRMTA